MTLNFKTVVPAAQAGSKAAQNQLIEHFYAWSVTHARSVVRESELAKDIAVDFWTWMFAERGVLEYNPAKGEFYPWMVMRLRYRAINALKRKKVPLVYLGGDESAEDVPASEEPADARAAAVKAIRGRDIEAFAQALPEGGDPDVSVSALQDIDQIVAQLTNDQQTVFWKLLEGENADQIAAECEVSVKRARNLISEVRRVIAAQIEAD